MFQSAQLIMYILYVSIIWISTPYHFQELPQLHFCQYGYRFFKLVIEQYSTKYQHRHGLSNRPILIDYSQCTSSFHAFSIAAQDPLGSTGQINYSDSPNNWATRRLTRIWLGSHNCTSESGSHKRPADSESRLCMRVSSTYSAAICKASQQALYVKAMKSMESARVSLFSLIDRCHYLSGCQKLMVVGELVKAVSKLECLLL